MTECGIPFLTYHHFAPTFKNFDDETKHDPDGMVALCATHALQADGGVFTDAQLREMKSQPFLAGEHVRGKNLWLRRDTVLRTGSSLFVSIKTLLTVCGKKVLWFDRTPDGYLQLSMNVTDSQGKPLFVMESNDWLTLGPLQDLEVAPRGRDIMIKSRTEGFWINLKFDEPGVDEVRSEIRNRMAANARRNIESQKASYAELRERFPDFAAFFGEQKPAYATEIEKEILAHFDSVIRATQLLEITLRCHLPAPVEVISTKNETKMGGMVMTEMLGIGPASILSFDCK